MWAIEGPAVIYVRVCSAYIFLQKFYGFWSFIFIFNSLLVYFCVSLESVLESVFYSW